MTNVRPRAILLDMDDTIIPDSIVSKQSWQQVCVEFATTRPELGLNAEELCQLIQERAAWFWSQPERHETGRLNLPVTRQSFVDHALRTLGVIDNVVDLAKDITERFLEIKEKLVIPFPGAIETISYLRKEGYQLALLTNGNGQRQRSKVVRHELTPFFDCILIEGELGYGKPDTRVYQQALTQLNVAPEETWMVGDNLQWEVLAPQKLGIRGIWVDHAGNGLPPHVTETPFAIIRTLTDLLPLLENAKA